MRYINGIYVSLFTKDVAYHFVTELKRVEKIAFGKQHLVTFTLSGLQIA